MNANLPEKPTDSSEFIFYQTEDGSSRIEVRLENETVWLSQRLLGELYQKDVRTINEQITLTNSSNAYAIFVRPKSDSTRKYEISTICRLTTILSPNKPLSSSRLRKTNSTGQSPVALTPKNPIWD
jgi:hypothetical protein